jgi:hypothetical protein
VSCSLLISYWTSLASVLQLVSLPDQLSSILSSNMAPYSITPAQLELTEGPTELVRLYVEFREIGGELRKGKVVSWDGPDSGYTVRILGRNALVRGILAVDMEFLANQEEIPSRLDVSGICSSSHDAEPEQRGKRRLSPKPAGGKRLKRERSASIFWRVPFLEGGAAAV